MAYEAPWSPFLDQLILSNLERPTCSWQHIAQKINRSPAAVRARAALLRERRECAVALAVHGNRLEHDETPPPGCVD
ncbi:MAG: hypothetical protein OXE44_19885 [Nitrospinae bacterium]|nr:hypothetical protein [Nitrospinota bacterium]